ASTGGAEVGSGRHRAGAPRRLLGMVTTDTSKPTKRDQRDIGLDALVIALNHRHDGVQGYVPPRVMQIVCLDLCVACRNFAKLNIVVDGRARLTRVRHARLPFQTMPRVSRVPALGGRVISWRTFKASVGHESEVVREQHRFLALGLRRLQRSRECDNAVLKPFLPGDLEMVTFGPSFNNTV
ncbi:unnamed protein product, partial [Laminaria digitata]